MPKFIVRPYFGHDCDSESGFNNGHYLNGIEVDADTEESAIENVLDGFIRNNIATGTKYEVHGTFGDNTLYWETCYNDGKGNEITEDEYSTLNENDSTGGYCYQYIDFNDVSEVPQVPRGSAE